MTDYAAMANEDLSARLEELNENWVGDYVKYAKPGKVCGDYYECVELTADEVSSVVTTVGAVWKRTNTQDFQVISAGYSADENLNIVRFHY